MVEGKDLQTIKSNFLFLFNNIINNDMSFNVKEGLINIKNKNTGIEVAELKSIVYELEKYYLLLVAIPLNTNEQIVNKEYCDRLKKGDIAMFLQLKAISFLYKKNTFLATLSNIAINSIKLYRDNYESQNKKFSLDNFPLIINYKEEYEIPVAVYNEMHKIEKYVGKFINEI
jgi:hypothetical protein